VLIAHGDSSFRELVKRHLGRAVRVVGDACDGEEAVWLAKWLRPDIVLMDMAMPLLAGPEAARRIKADRVETKVVLLTSEDEQERARALGRVGANFLFLHADALLAKDTVLRSRRAGR
jgi:DNA-binding NarL/FixJ family response regulator